MIRTSEVDQWVSKLSAEGLSASTVKSAYSLLSGALEAATRDGILSRNPAKGVRLPQPEQRQMRILTPTEINDLVGQMGRQARCMALIGAFAGLRWGETAALKLEKVDLLRRRIQITHSLSEVNGAVSIGPPKTSSSYRSVSIPKLLAQELDQYFAQTPITQDGFIFTASNGALLRPRNWRRRVWLPAVKASLGLPLRYHDLRHSHVAMLIQQGQHPKVIQERLGHASIRTTLDVYGHLFEGIDESAAAALDLLANQHGLSKRA